MPQIDAEYIKTGRLKYVIREFPLEAIHPHAFKAAEAALCAGDQGKYFAMHDRMFGNQRTLGPAELPGHAQAVGVDLAPFQRCLEEGKYTARVRKDLTDGQSAGVTGTPAFFIGLTDPKTNTFKSVIRITGAQPYPAFKEAIDRVLATP